MPEITAHQYRTNAAECRLLASSMPDAEHRRMTLSMALDWDKLATEADNASADVFVKRICPAFP